eukprot:3461305-Karenia_brevis.AAC.1
MTARPCPQSNNDRRLLVVEAWACLWGDDHMLPSTSVCRRCDLDLQTFESMSHDRSLVSSPAE